MRCPSGNPRPWPRRRPGCSIPCSWPTWGIRCGILLVRSRLLYVGRNVHNMHRAATGSVNAGAQAQALERMAPLLSPRRQRITRRGRNAHARHPAPRNQNPADYQAATALEALVGFLYVTGQEERLLALFQRSQEEDTHA